MGEVIQLAERRALRAQRRERRPAHARSGPLRAEFVFDLACPFTYLAAERVERAFGAVTWTPATVVPTVRRLPADRAAERQLRRAAQARAAQLRMPLVWPERWPDAVPAAMRVATLAAERGRGAAYALAAGRLAYCGGFDLDDPETVAEAAAAAGLSLDECLEAADDPRRDLAVEAAGRRLRAEGAERLPALRVGDALFSGEDRVGEALVAARTQAAATLL